jgi:hypothetical protein
MLASCSGLFFNLIFLNHHIKEALLAAAREMQSALGMGCREGIINPAKPKAEKEEGGTLVLSEWMGSLGPCIPTGILTGIWPASRGGLAAANFWWCGLRTVGRV